MSALPPHQDLQKWNPSYLKWWRKKLIWNDLTRWYKDLATQRMFRHLFLNAVGVWMNEFPAVSLGVPEKIWNSCVHLQKRVWGTNYIMKSVFTQVLQIYKNFAPETVLMDSANCCSPELLFTWTLTNASPLAAGGLCKVLPSLFPRTLQSDLVSTSRCGLDFQCNLWFSKLTWTSAQWTHAQPDLAWTWLGFYDLQNLHGSQEPFAKALLRQPLDSWVRDSTVKLFGIEIRERPFAEQ